MRYEDWDIILFPSGQDEDVPFKEFKVTCHVVPDHELGHIHKGMGMPVMTCFVPSLPTNHPFQVSIHCWRPPQLSQFVQNYSKHTECVKFEARILIDGHLVSTSAFDRNVDGPHRVTTTYECTKTGELQPLRFPHFRQELLHQNHWNPNDDIGRIKVVISEGFPRDSLSVPIERLKNVVTFSFQHAPLKVLETSNIAWPNPAMWHRPGFNPHVAPLVPTFRAKHGPESHAHSPRRHIGKLQATRLTKPQGFPPSVSAANPYQVQAHHPHPHTSSNLFSTPGFQMPPNPRVTPGSGLSLSYPDPFSEPAAYVEWMNSMTFCQPPGELGGNKNMWSSSSRSASKNSSNDTSMPDYGSSQSFGVGLGEPMHLSGNSLEEDPLSTQVPTNTPTAAPGQDNQRARYTMPGQQYSSLLPPELATSLTHSLLNQPHPLPVMPHTIPLPSSEVKSRKENRHLTIGHPSSSQSTPQNGDHAEIRKFSQPSFSLVGNLGGSNLAISSSAGENPIVNSPSLQTIFSAATSNAPSAGTVSRNNSAGEFVPNQSSNAANGNGNTAAAAPNRPLADASNTALSSSAGNTAGVKRTRNFTPASLKAIDDEDEPRRASPRARTGAYTANTSDTVE